MNMSELVGVDDLSEFFAPASTDLVDGLIGQYRSMHDRICELYAAVTGEMAGAMGYAMEGNRDSDRYQPSVSSIFSPSGQVKAIANLDAAYWSKAIQLTDVIQYMPQARRDEWHKSIREMTCPEFTEDTVRGTLQALLAQRHQFLAERVDGIFRGLSGEHITNSPAAFGKRMIVGYVLNEYWSAQYNKCGLINDLRCVIAKFMGRDEPGYRASEGLILALKGRWGEWVQVDGGALKIRLYKKGTAHIEVHPDMAWRLNSVLAHLYPRAIPPEFRQKPKRKAKDIELIQRPLSFAVIDALASMKQATRMIKQEGNLRDPLRHEKVSNALQSEYNDKHGGSELASVLEAIGGVKAKEGWWQFDYNPSDIIAGIVASGCIPDQKAHQFYPTPEKIARVAVDLAAIGEHDTCLEPSAGIGGIADYLPTDRTTCVETSTLHSDILKAKGFAVVCDDFLKVSTETTFDRIVMNPPFDQGRWQAHTEAAASMLKSDGRLVAILPMSAKGKDLLPGFNCSYPKTFDNEFSGTSISVVIMVAERIAA